MRFTFPAALILISLSATAGEIDLPVIQKTGTAAEALQYDPIRPSAETRMDAGTRGGPSRDFENELPFSVTEQGQPGSLAQIKGFGLTSSELDAQTLGISINPAQGGSFDLSSFPSYFWENANYRLGPSLGATDAQGASGTLNFTPWTAAAIRKEGVSGMAFANYSELEVGQLAVSYSSGNSEVANSSAALAGVSMGKLRGPGLQLSSRRGDFRAHLLASDLTQDSRGSRSFSTPRATQRTARAIPVLEWDHKIGEARHQVTLYYDALFLRYEDPDSIFGGTQDVTQQAGIVQSLVLDDWKFGISGRYVQFRKLDFTAPEEGLLKFQASRLIETRSALLDFSAGGAMLTRYGVRPELSLGGRWGGVYSRLSYTNRFPSLVDRFYSTPPFAIGNPALQPERDYTAIIGLTNSDPKALESNALRVGVEIYAQRKNDPQVSTITAGVYQVRNRDSASVVSLVPSASIRISKGLELKTSLALSKSWIEGGEFPYLARWISTTTALWEFAPQSHIELSQRVSSSAEVGSGGDRIAGYAYWDLRAKTRLLGYLDGALVIENLSDRAYELKADFPMPGRSLAFEVAARI